MYSDRRYLRIRVRSAMFYFPDRAAVVNLEGIDLDVAQRIIDFISGSCYAMAGNIEKISNYIFIVTPESIEISGDIHNAISSGIRIPSFNTDNF